MRTLAAGLAVMAMVAALGWAGPVTAQQVKEVTFKAGKTTASEAGMLTGSQYVDYQLAGKAGEQVQISLHSNSAQVNGAVYFSVTSPSGQTLYDSSNGENRTTVNLPEAGTYIVRVFLSQADADGGATIDYSMGITVP